MMARLLLLLTCYLLSLRDGRGFVLIPSKRAWVGGSPRRSLGRSVAASMARRGQQPEGNHGGRKDENQNDNVKRSKEEEDAILGFAIDSFLRGDYNLKLPGDGGNDNDDDVTNPFIPPPVDLGPSAVVSTALRSLRGQDLPSQTHGAAVFMRFCLPLRRSERWGDASSSIGGKGGVAVDPFKEVLRGGLTASTLVRRIRASADFSPLLDWSSLDVTEGAYTSDRDLVYHLPSIAYVNAALFFEDEDAEPCLFQFKLRRVLGGGAWMIDTVRRSQKELFLETDQSGKSSKK